MLRKLARPWIVVTAAAVVAAVTLLALLPLPAASGRIIVPSPPAVHTREASNTDLTLTSLGPGHALDGFITNPDFAFDTATEPYPTLTSSSVGFSPFSVQHAGIIVGTPADGIGRVELYCIDIRTATFLGVGYHLDTWADAHVPNLGLVTRLLSEYYPETNEPSSLTDLNDKAAAVQAAIWYFTDGFVLSPGNSLFPVVKAIVTRIQEEGPVAAPEPPSISISPGHLDGSAGSVIGPYTVTSSLADATVTATGAQMYSSAAADPADLIPNGSLVPNGTQIWLKSTGPANAVLEAHALATIPTGNVFLYDGNSSLGEAQKMIIAHTDTLEASAYATAEFRATGSLTVDKTITGPAAGEQGRVVIQTVCDGGKLTLTPDFVIDAHAAEGTYSHTYTDVPADSVCSVTAIEDGHTSTVIVTVVGDGDEVDVPSGGHVTAHLTDTYEHVPDVPGELLVSKTISGPAAGQQGAVTIAVTCALDGTQNLSEQIHIPAGTPAGTTEHAFTHIPVGSVCTVLEIHNGQTDTVTATVIGNDQHVTVSGTEAVAAGIVDIYDFASGVLTVTKTIHGRAAGEQGQIQILVECAEPDDIFAFVIPAGTKAGSIKRSFDGIPAGSRCVITEVANGSTSAVSVVVHGGRQQVTVPANGSAEVRLSDHVSPVVPVTG